MMYMVSNEITLVILKSPNIVWLDLFLSIGTCTPKILEWGAGNSPFIIILQLRISTTILYGCGKVENARSWNDKSRL
jgi:hypothetical protein